MSKKKNKHCCKKMNNECCCCEPVCCCTNNNNNSRSGFLGGECGVAPIIFLLIACGSGLLNCRSSFLIILLFILFGGCFFNSRSNGMGCNSCC